MDWFIDVQIWKLPWSSTRKFNRVAQQVEENWPPHSQKWSAQPSLHFRQTKRIETMCCWSLCWCHHLFIEARRAGDEMDSVRSDPRILGGYLSINAQWWGRPAMARTSLITLTSCVLLYNTETPGGRHLVAYFLPLFFGDNFPSWKESEEELDWVFCLFLFSSYTACDALFLIGFIYVSR